MTTASSAMFTSPEARESIRAWGDRFARAVPHESRVVSTSFGDTHVRVLGPEGAPPLVVLHGAMASSGHVLPEVALVARGHRVFALDVIGQSAASADRRIDLRGDDYGRWLFECADALSLGSFALLGVSWGGFVSLRAARVDVSRLRALVLLVPAGVVNNSLWRGLRDGGFAFLAYKLRPSRARLDRLLATIFTEPDEAWTEYFEQSMRLARPDLRVPPLATDAELEAISCPTLVFGAELDGSFPGAALVERARQRVPRVECELLAETRHCPPFSEAFRQGFAERVERFLAAIPESVRG